MGTLYVVATPIGNLGDITIRAMETLFRISIVACEDTRKTGFLLSELAKRYPSYKRNPNQKLLRYDNATEQNSAGDIISQLEAGIDIALVSDAGTPLISDPGYVLVSLCQKKGIPVVTVPGASAAVAALSISGLPSHSFLFLGYPPEKTSHRESLFLKLKSLYSTLPVTCIFYVSPHKWLGFVESIEKELPKSEVAICRELTKQHEEVWRGNTTSLREAFPDIKGEVVVLVTKLAET